MSEVMTNSLEGDIRIVSIRAGALKNFAVEFSGVGERVPELPIITGDVDSELLKKFTSAPFIVSPGEPFEMVAHGQVRDPAKSATMHGFMIRYEYDGRDYTAQSPSSLTFSADECD